MASATAFFVSVREPFTDAASEKIKRWYTFPVMEGNVGSISIACYRPRAGCEDALLELVRNHLPPLRSEGLVTERASIVMHTADGTIVEVFEWVSQEAIAGAHHNPRVIELWKRFEAVCIYEVPANVAEFQKMFSHFEPI